MTTNITISNSLLVAVDRLAEQLEMTRYDLVRRAIERYLEQEGARAVVLEAIASSAHDDDDW
jgi:predicted transcriptional regulator